MSRRLGFTPPPRPHLEQLLKKVKEWWAGLSDEERQAHLNKQRRSWVRGEMGIGSDRDEAEYRAALAQGDTETLKRLDAEAAERAGRVK